MSDSPRISTDKLTPALRKHADPAAPLPLRSMGARLLVPTSPQDAVCLLYLLSFDPDESVREQALQSAAGLPDKIASTALRDDGLPQPVLGWLAGQVGANETFLEMLVLNQATPDEALVEVVRKAPARIAELVAQNQLRLLRCEELLCALLSESKAARSVIDTTADFAIRSGIYRDDVPALVDAHRRIHGDVPHKPPEHTAVSVLEEFPEELAREEEQEIAEERRLTLTQRLLSMTVSEKIKLATLGNKEARTILLRDTNKLVAVAAVQSPRITESEIVALTNSRTVHEDVLRVIYTNREWLKLYLVKYNLVKNPKTPLPTALRFLPHVRPNDLRDLSKNKNVPHAIQTGARNLTLKQQKH
ncbi:hypothetical protein [Vulgatibacter sp.]|uniref:hypothetical protein n=1 Tax=Vulgatibacter sp. TaxID=1971226 RepID=UPI003561FEE4